MIELISEIEYDSLWSLYLRTGTLKALSPRPMILHALCHLTYAIV